MQELYSDTSSKIDLLNRKPFAAGIARTLVYGLPQGNESLVFGLNGRWGSGKSTLIHLITEEIREIHKFQNNDRYEIFEFNPWMFSGQEQLLWSFYNYLVKKLVEPKSKFFKYAQDLTSWLNKSKFGKISQAIFGEKHEKTIKGLKHLIGEGMLEDIKKKIDNVLIAEKIQLYIIIDDLDRLTPDEITQIFQLVKLNANFKNTVFLLAYDKDIIVNAVDQKFRSNGERYLSKIVQVDYTVPEVLEEDIERFFFEKIKSLFEKMEIPFSPEAQMLKEFWSRHGLKNYFKTLRDVYRYLNGLSFRLPVIWQEVNIDLFLVVEAVRVFDFAAYQNLYFESLDHFRRIGSFPNFDSDNKWATDYFPNSTTRELLKKINGKININWMKTGQDLFNSDTFERYFALHISETNLPEKDFTDFLSNPEQSFERITQIYKKGRLENLLQRLSAPGWERKFPLIDLNIIEPMVRFFDNSLGKEERKKYLFLLDSSIDAIKMSNQSDPKKISLIKASLYQFTANTYPHTTLVNLIARKWNLDLEADGQEEDKLRRRVIKNLQEHAKNWQENLFKEILIGDDDIRSLLFVLSKYEPGLYEKSATQYLNTPGKIVWILEPHFDVDRSNKPCRWIKSASPFLTSTVINHFEKVLSNLSADQLDVITPDTATVVHFFLKTYSEINPYSEGMSTSQRVTKKHNTKKPSG